MYKLFDNIHMVGYTYNCQMDDTHTQHIFGGTKMNELVNGVIVNEYDELVGEYHHIVGDRFWVTLYGVKTEMSRKVLIKKVNDLELYTVPEWG